MACQQEIIIKASQKMKPVGMNCGFIPEKNMLTKPNNEKRKYILNG